MERACRRILISVQKDNKAVASLPPGEKLPFEVPQSNDLWTVSDALFTELTGVLFIDRFLTVTSTGDVDRHNSCRVAVPSLELGPGPLPQIPIIHTRVCNSSCQEAHRKLECSTILLEGEGLIGVKCCNRS